MFASLRNLNIVIIIYPILGGCVTCYTVRQRANRFTFENRGVQFMMLFPDIRNIGNPHWHLVSQAFHDFN